MLTVFNSDFIKEEGLERTETSLGVKKTGSLPTVISSFFMIFFWLPSYSTWGWLEGKIGKLYILINGQHQDDISNDGRKEKTYRGEKMQAECGGGHCKEGCVTLGSGLPAA